MRSPFDPSAVPYQRPSSEQRLFLSDGVESAIREMTGIARPDVAGVFERALPMTLDTAVTVRDFEGRPDAFVITGDIPAMWPRDATNSVWAYLPLLKDDPAIQRLVEGVLHREVACLLHDAYANAFYDFRFGASGRDKGSPAFGAHADDLTTMKEGIHERKYELDTLGALLRLSVGFFEAGGRPGAFDANWLAAIRRVLEVVRDQQKGSDEEDTRPGGPAYTFLRKTPFATDTLVLRGRGQPAKSCGLSKSPFRPSDDASQLPFSIPANAMAAVGLKGVASIIRSLELDQELACDCDGLSDELTRAIDIIGVVEHPVAGRIYAYEVDGFGNAYFMDDANVPSLLSLPYLGYCSADEETWQRTRAMIWSAENPYFAKGTAAEGVGGPHIGRSNIWPMSILMHALTSTSDEEIDRDLRILCSTDGGCRVMHESFHKDDSTNYTRPWFCWPNALFAELVMTLARTRPHLLI